MQEGKEQWVLVGFKDRKALFEKTPHKYECFLDDNSTKEGYWVDIVDKNKIRFERATKVHECS